MRPVLLLAVLAVVGLLGSAWLWPPSRPDEQVAERATVPGGSGPPRETVSAVRTPGSPPSSAPPGDTRRARERQPSDLAPTTVETSSPLAPGSPAPAATDDAVEDLVAITGTLRHESGAFARTAEEILGAVHLDIVPSARTAGEEPAGLPEPRLTPVLNDEGAVQEIAFSFGGLTAGHAYEITLSTMDHQRWTGPAVREYAPNEGVEFLCFGEDESVPLRFIVTDAATGEALDGRWSASEIRITESDANGVLVHAAPLSLEDFPVHGELDFAIEADGYRPAFGDRGAFERDPASGALTARVALERGFSARVVVLGREGSRVLARGAEVHLDGAYAGRTDGSGSLVLERGESPERIEVRWRGQGLAGPLREVLLTRRSGLRIALLEAR